LVDKALILRKLAELEEYLNQIRQYSAITLEDYSGDWKVQRIVERTLQMMIELTVDISNHLISDKRLRVPTGYADTFKVLFETGLMDEAIYQIMEKMAKFRNIVIHHYDKVDASIVITILGKHLDDFLVFRDAILKIIKEDS
jgi:uncharacterized protein YutE (UPF0331/DUF86 family)